MAGDTARLPRGTVVFQAYYCLTPLFMILDYCFGYDVRVPLVAHVPYLKGAYYGGLIACGIAAAGVPRIAAPIALIESSWNFAMIVAGFYGAYWGFAVSMGTARPLPNPITIQAVINTVLTGSFLIASIRSNPWGRRISPGRRSRAE
jgi:hypothetical protein